MNESHDPIETETEGDYVEFARVGTPANGDFECTSCGYGITIARELPRCPMCGAGVWERSPWSPFARTLAGLRSRLS